MSVKKKLASVMSRSWRSIYKAPRSSMDYARQRPKRVFISLGSLVLLFLLVSGAFTYMRFTRENEEGARHEAEMAGRNGVTALLSYDHNTVGQGRDLDKRRNLLTGRFQRDYLNLMRNVVIPGSQQQQLMTSTNVARSSVIRDEGPDKVWLLLFLNQTTKVGNRPDPASNGSRVRVGMQHVNGRWAISEVTPL